MINKSKTIFELEVCYIRYKYDAKRDIDLPLSYPFDLEKTQIGFFSSLRKAESAIKKCNWEDAYCFYVTEYRVDNNIESIPNIATYRSYLPDGKLEEHCLSFEYDTAFKMDIKDLINKTPEELRSIGVCPGMKPEEIRFKKGDLVEVIDFDHVFLGIVVSTPMTIESVKERAIRVGRFYDGDDMYDVLEWFPRKKEAGYNHYFSINLFPPRLPIPKKLKENLQAAYQSHIKMYY